MSEQEIVNSDDIDALLAEVEQIAADVNDTVDTKKEELKKESTAAGAKPEQKQEKEAGQDDIDALLAEVEQITGEVKETVEEEKEKPKEEKIDSGEKSTPKEQQDVGQDDIDALLAEVEQTVSDPVSNESDKSDKKDEPRAGEPADGVMVDEQTEQIADDEINDILANAGKKTKDSEQAPSPAAEPIVIPKPVQAALITLAAMDRPFLWIPKTAKDILGIVAIASLILSIILFIIASVS